DADHAYRITTDLGFPDNGRFRIPHGLPAFKAIGVLVTNREHHLPHIERFFTLGIVRTEDVTNHFEVLPHIVLIRELAHITVDRVLGRQARAIRPLLGHHGDP